jgi:long-subunit fatty acid transport protein
LIEAAAANTASLFDTPAEAASLPSALPAFARVSLNSGLNTAEPARRAPVRVYHGPSRLIMVGTVDAVCRMIDRCIADEANVHGAVFES